MNKERELSARLQCHGYDLVPMKEIWLDFTICDGEIFPSSYQVIRKDRLRNGGGILLACSDHLDVKRCFEYETESKVLWCVRL